MTQILCFPLFVSVVQPKSIMCLIATSLMNLRSHVITMQQSVSMLSSYYHTSFTPSCVPLLGNPLFLPTQMDGYTDLPHCFGYFLIPCIALDSRLFLLVICSVVLPCLLPSQVVLQFAILIISPGWIWKQDFHIDLNRQCPPPKYMGNLSFTRN